jgi:hypothetical protein
VSDGPGDSIARDSNAANNAMHQDLRLERWTQARDALWSVIDPLLAAGARVALVGGGSCDDVPLARIAARAGSITLVDLDPLAASRGVRRLGAGAEAAATVDVHLEDVTDGCADAILQAVRDERPLPEGLPLPYGPIAGGGFDLVVGDMLYTQLLHAGLVALGIHGPRQLELMRRYDPPLATSLVQRIQGSLARGGHAIHVHDVACWAAGHDQPLTLDAALADPDRAWRRLRRHDACDPHLVLERLDAAIAGHAWWRWPFEPNKQFLVRASVARAPVAAGSTTARALRVGMPSIR